MRFVLRYVYNTSALPDTDTSPLHDMHCRPCSRDHHPPNGELPRIAQFHRIHFSGLRDEQDIILEIQALRPGSKVPVASGGRVDIQRWLLRRPIAYFGAAGIRCVLHNWRRKRTCPRRGWAIRDPGMHVSKAGLFQQLYEYVECNTVLYRGCPFWVSWNAP